MTELDKLSELLASPDLTPEQTLELMEKQDRLLAEMMDKNNREHRIAVQSAAEAIGRLKAVGTPVCERSFLYRFRRYSHRVRVHLWLTVVLILIFFPMVPFLNDNSPWMFPMWTIAFFLSLVWAIWASNSLKE